MRRTRRKLYGKSRRRQRGKGVGTICKWVLLGALASFSGAHAEDIGFRARVSNWFNNPNSMDPAPSIDLANYIVDMKWAPSLNLYPETCATPSGINEKDVVGPYLLEGKRYKITSGPTTGDIRKDIIVTFKRLIPGDEYSPAEYVLERESDNYEGSPTKGEEYYISEKEVTLSPVGGGRKQRRKTLRRK